MSIRERLGHRKNEPDRKPLNELELRPMDPRFNSIVERRLNYMLGGPNIDGYNPFADDFGLEDKNEVWARGLLLSRAMYLGEQDKVCALLNIHNSSSEAYWALVEFGDILD